MRRAVYSEFEDEIPLKQFISNPKGLSWIVDFSFWSSGRINIWWRVWLEKPCRVQKVKRNQNSDRQRPCSKSSNSFATLNWKEKSISYVVTSLVYHLSRLDYDQKLHTLLILHKTQSFLQSLRNHHSRRSSQSLSLMRTVRVDLKMFIWCTVNFLCLLNLYFHGVLDILSIPLLI